MSSFQMMVSRLIRTGMIMAVLGALPLEISYFLKAAMHTPERGCSGAVDRQPVSRQTGAAVLGAKFHPSGTTRFQMLGTMRFHESGTTQFHVSGTT